MLITCQMEPKLCHFIRRIERISEFHFFFHFRSFFIFIVVAAFCFIQWVLFLSTFFCFHLLMLRIISECMLFTCHSRVFTKCPKWNVEPLEQKERTKEINCNTLTKLSTLWTTAWNGTNDDWSNHFEYKVALLLISFFHCQRPYSAIFPCHAFAISTGMYCCEITFNSSFFPWRSSVSYKTGSA